MIGFLTRMDFIGSSRDGSASVLCKKWHLVDCPADRFAIGKVGQANNKEDRMDWRVTGPI